MSSPPQEEETARTPRARSALATLAAELVAHDLTFSTFVYMLPLLNSPAPIPLARLSIMIGHSYHATRNQVHRKPWFNVHPADPVVTVSLNRAGRDKAETFLNSFDQAIRREIAA